MWMKGLFMLFLSLGLGYVLCVLAKKQQGILKTVGYTLGISILILSFISGIICSEVSGLKKHCPISTIWYAMSKSCPMSERR